MSKTVGIEENFLLCLLKEKVAVTIFLVNGVKLQGIISQFDHGTLLLRRDGHVQLVYKSAISTIMPASALSGSFEEELTIKLSSE